MTNKNMSGCVESPVTRECRLKSQVATLFPLVEWLKLRPTLAKPAIPRRELSLAEELSPSLRGSQRELAEHPECFRTGGSSALISLNLSPIRGAGTES